MIKARRKTGKERERGREKERQGEGGRRVSVSTPHVKRADGNRG